MTSSLLLFSVPPLTAVFCAVLYRFIGGGVYEGAVGGRGRRLAISVALVAAAAASIVLTGVGPVSGGVKTFAVIVALLVGWRAGEIGHMYAWPPACARAPKTAYGRFTAGLGARGMFVRASLQAAAVSAVVFSVSFAHGGNMFGRPLDQHYAFIRAFFTVAMPLVACTLAYGYHITVPSNKSPTGCCRLVDVPLAEWVAGATLGIVACFALM